jgi:hypothetical protein
MCKCFYLFIALPLPINSSLARRGFPLLLLPVRMGGCYLGSVHGTRSPLTRPFQNANKVIIILMKTHIILF